MAHSLRGRLLWWLPLPLAVFVLIAGAMSYDTARTTAALVQDSALVASARTIGEDVEWRNGLPVAGRAAGRAGDLRIAVARFGVLQGDRRPRPPARGHAGARRARAAWRRADAVRHVARRRAVARGGLRSPAVRRGADRDGDGGRREDDAFARRDGRDDLAAAAGAPVADAGARDGAGTSASPSRCGR